MVCSFGSAGILALASTCKVFAIGLKPVVRRASALVAWEPNHNELLRYVWKYMAKDRYLQRDRYLWREVGAPQAFWLVSEFQSRGSVHLHAVHVS